MTIGELKRIARGGTTGRTQFIKKYQTAKDIARQMKRAEYASRPFSRKLRKFFDGETDREKCLKVWTYLKNNVKYKREPLHKQTAKTVARFIVDSYGDCKHYSTFAVGLLNSLGVPAWFVLVGQRKGIKTPNHAYCQALVGKRIVTIDPCRKNFNDECRHFYKYNVAPIKK